MAPTVAEQRGWIDRAGLEAMSGRSRTPQIELAMRLGVVDYPQPSGGCCYLPDESYARKLRDLLAHRGHDLDPDEMMLLKLGRHFRVGPALKVIVGRNRSESEMLERFTAGRGTLRVAEHTGAFTLIEGTASASDLELACSIAARYSSARGADKVRVRWQQGDTDGTLIVRPMTSDLDLDSMRV